MASSVRKEVKFWDGESAVKARLWIRVRKLKIDRQVWDDRLASAFHKHELGVSVLEFVAAQAMHRSRLVHRPVDGSHPFSVQQAAC